MKRRTLLMCAALVVSLVAAISGTLAYLTDTETTSNVMTVGNVDIELTEWKRPDQSKADLTDNLTAFESHAMELYPVVTTKADYAFANDALWLSGDVIGAVDKMVQVENTGSSDAYFRTLIAFQQIDDMDNMLHINWNTEDYAITKLDGTFDYLGKTYVTYAAVYKKALESKTAAEYSLLQVALDGAATNDTITSIDGKYSILVAAQAIQTTNFDVLVEAAEDKTAKISEILQSNFGTPTADENPWDGTLKEFDVTPETLKTVEMVDGGVYYLADGEYKFPTASMKGKAITFKGSKNAVIDLTGVQVNLFNNITGAELTFDGVTVNWKATESYQGLKDAKKVVYKNCAINGLQYLYGDAEFINCTFNNKNCWSIWTYGAHNAAFTDCTFNTGGHAVLIYNEQTNSNFVANVTMTNCTFNNDGTVAEPWGPEQLVETGTNANNTETSNRYNLTFNNCKVTGEGTQKLWGNKNSMDADHLSITIDGVKYPPLENVVDIATPETLGSAVAAAIAGADGAVVNLGSGSYTFPQTLMNNKTMVFKGDGNTVVDMTAVDHNNQFVTGAALSFENMTINWSDNNEGYQGLANAEKVVYKNCTINGTQFMYGDADFINCTFVTSNSYSVYGRGVGTLTFTDCTFETGGRAIMLYADQATNVAAKLTNCTFSDNGAYTSKVKAVVETGDTSKKDSKFDIEFVNCKITEGFEENNSTSALWGNKDSMPKDRLNVVIDGEDVY